MATRVASLTGGAQIPGMEMRVDDTVFATGLWAEAGRALSDPDGAMRQAALQAESGRQRRSPL